MQRLGREHSDSTFFMNLASSRSDEVIANMSIVLIHQADTLLYKLIESISNKFLQEGGFREKLHRARVATRQQEE